MLHGRRNVRFESGSLLDPERAGGQFGMIDAYGVIHHLDDPAAGLAALASRLAVGGILRLMVYSRYARREEESIRRALRLLRVDSPDSVRKLAERARAGSRFKGYLAGSPEAAFREGLADALLHPCVHAFRIDELLELIQGSGLELLRFGHGGALEDVTDEIGRIRQLEAERESPGNFLAYLGRKVKGGCRDDDRSYIMLNPCLKEVTGFLPAGGTSVAPRLGRENLPLGWSERRFLARFRDPVQLASLSQEMRLRIREYRKRLFLLSFHL
jgi:SAM-dependent methyltransferase